MIIKSSSLADFECLTDSLIQGGITDVRILSSQEKRGASVSAINDFSTPNTAFTYALFSPVYHVVYSGCVPNAEFERLDESFNAYRKSRGDALRVQEFESIRVDGEAGMIHVKNLVKVY